MIHTNGEYRNKFLEKRKHKYKQLIVRTKSTKRQIKGNKTNQPYSQ